MTELAFAKSFLSTVDSRPVKLRYDHVIDPASMRVPIPVRGNGGDGLRLRIHLIKSFGTNKCHDLVYTTTVTTSASSHA